MVDAVVIIIQLEKNIPKFFKKLNIKNINFKNVLQKKIPNNGTASEVGGDKSDSIVRKKQIERSTVISIKKYIFYLISN